MKGNGGGVHLGKRRGREERSEGRRNCGQNAMSERRIREIKYKEEGKGSVNCFYFEKERISAFQIWKSVFSWEFCCFNVLELNDFLHFFSKLLREMVRKSGL